MNDNLDAAEVREANIDREQTEESFGLSGTSYERYELILKVRDGAERVWGAVIDFRGHTSGEIADITISDGEESVLATGVSIPKEQRFDNELFASDDETAEFEKLQQATDLSEDDQSRLDALKGKIHARELAGILGGVTLSVAAVVGVIMKRGTGTR